jgi:protein-arginine kinase activator protein McsA
MSDVCANCSGAATIICTYSVYNGGTVTEPLCEECAGILAGLASVSDIEATEFLSGEECGQ